MSIKVFRMLDDKPRPIPFNRPFHLCNQNIEIVDDLDGADFVLTTHPGLNELIKNNNIDILKKTVIYANDDDPSWAMRESYSYKFFGQPNAKLAELEKYNAMPIPIVMIDHIPIHEDIEYINYLRSLPKKKDFYFAGQLHYANRQLISKLQLNNSDIKQTQTIVGKTPEQKLGSIKKYLEELAQAKFGFAPRGTGSSSFRLYECLLVGTIPIATDAIQLPFTDLVNWDDFSITGRILDLDSLVRRARETDCDTLRINGMDFFDKYCNTRQLNSWIVDRLIKSNPMGMDFERAI